MGEHKEPGATRGHGETLCVLKKAKRQRLGRRKIDNFSGFSVVRF
jgi:hypothetical protein